MDEECQETLKRHTRCDEVTRCLELAGYKTREVLACIANDLDTEIRLIEDSVRRACSHMDEEERRSYIGLYARSPEEFRFPIGEKRALLLAVRELAQASRVTCDASTQTPTSANHVQSQIAVDFHNACWPHAPPGHPVNPSAPSLPQLPIFATESNVSGSAVSTAPTPPVPLAGPVTASRVHFHPIYGVSNAGELSSTSTAASPGNATHMAGHPHSVLFTGNGSLGAAAGPNPVGSNGASPAEHDVVVDLEKLKNNSTASIIRLSAKQYHDAELIEGRDFEVKIEVTTGEDGYKRATGIYCCHLCLGKRGEVSAVRFSIAKNRYPVVSNVMSHLKIHFVARLPPLPRNMMGHAAAAAAAAAAASGVPVGAISGPPNSAASMIAGQAVWPHMVKQEAVSAAAAWAATSQPSLKQENWPAVTMVSNAVWPSPQAVNSAVGGPEVGADLAASPTESTTEATSLDSNERC